METPNILRYAELTKELKQVKETLAPEMIAIVCRYMAWNPEDLERVHVLTSLGLALEVYHRKDQRARYLFSFGQKDGNVFARLDFREQNEIY